VSGSIERQDGGMDYTFISFINEILKRDYSDGLIIYSNMELEKIL